MALNISKNTGKARFFIDAIAAGVVRDANGDVAIFKAHGSDFIDVRTGEIYTAAQVAAYLLDTYSAFAAYSVRQLKSTATNCIRVRRTTPDSTEADIGFVDGWLDEAAIASHCGAGDGFVTKWYDQSGNGYDASQTTVSRQPKIYASGAVLKENGKPLVTGVDATTYLRTNAGFSSEGTPDTIFTVCKFGTIAEYICDGIGGRRSISTGGTTFYLLAGTFLNTTQANAFTQNLHSAVLHSTSTYRFNGSTIISTGNAGTDSITDIVLMNANTFNGGGADLQEYILFNTDFSANFSAIESDINTAFSIY